MKFSSILSLWFTANNCRCLLPWTWVEVLIVVAICALSKRKKKPGFINPIRMHELKCPVILWVFFFWFLLLLDFLSLPSPHPLFFLLFLDAESLQNAAKPSEQN